MSFKDSEMRSTFHSLHFDTDNMRYSSATNLNPISKTSHGSARGKCTWIMRSALQNWTLQSKYQQCFEDFPHRETSCLHLLSVLKLNSRADVSPCNSNVNFLLHQEKSLSWNLRSTKETSCWLIATILLHWALTSPLIRRNFHRLINHWRSFPESLLIHYSSVIFGFSWTRNFKADKIRG